MAKMKTFAVTVEITVRETLYVEARRPNGATERVLTEEGWANATSYDDNDWIRHRRRDAKVVNVREAGF